MKNDFFYINNGNVLVCKDSIIRIDVKGAPFSGYYIVDDVVHGHYGDLVIVSPINKISEPEESFNESELDQYYKQNEALVWNR